MKKKRTVKKKNTSPGDHAMLTLAAETAKNRAYAPYSLFHVGAALLGRSGRIYTGCNVENRSYGLTVCAERNAVAQAIVAGERSFDAIVIASDAEPPAPPCGACREVLAELNDDLPITLVGKAGSQQHHQLRDLLPSRFVFSGPKKTGTPKGK
jgi:cytidine deaminase